MFTCQICRKVFPPRTPSFKVVTETRPVHYPFRFQAHHFRAPDKRGVIKDQIKDDKGGFSREISREVTACRACAEALRASRLSVPAKTSNVLVKAKTAG
ncbi:MAG: hypothetical protein K1Y36_22150 [Blastocatellia bacterium]|nr:hypothetical protein [Blastocatellia bacterium]